MPDPYIVFEAILGAGKTTQARLLTEFLKGIYSAERVTDTREPGGTWVSDRIREEVLRPIQNEPVSVVTDAYLFAASRAQSLRNLVRPMLDKGRIVLSDRSFISSLVNQGCGDGLTIDKVLDINKHAIEGNLPGLVLYIKVPFEVGWARRHDLSHDKFDSYSQEFYTRVLQGYEVVSKMNGLFTRWETIDGNRPQDAVFRDIKAKTLSYLKEIGYK